MVEAAGSKSAERDQIMSRKSSDVRLLAASLLSSRHPGSRGRKLAMAKVLCVLYDDPIDGMPTSYPRDDLPQLDRYPDGQTLPTPHGIDFTPGELLGCVSGELGLRHYLEGAGHTWSSPPTRTAPTATFERELVDADVVISQPFWPAYLTAERIAKAKNLKLAITAGHRLRPCRPPGRDRAGHHRRRSHLLQLDQRRRACRDDDPRRWSATTARRTTWCARRRLEHRRLRRALLRCRGHARRHGRRGADRRRRCCGG